MELEVRLQDRNKRKNNGGENNRTYQILYFEEIPSIFRILNYLFYKKVNERMHIINNTYNVIILDLS